MSGRRGTVIVFARRPRPGRVKRRLARVVGRRFAAHRYAQLLARTLEEIERMPAVRPLLLCAEARDRAWFRARLRRPRWQVGSQPRGDLGRRMGWAFEVALRTASPVLLCGSDVVDFTAEDLHDAFDRLEAGCDVVLGPAADGGYWLVGMRRAHPALFEDIPWGGAGVLARTLERARGLEVGLLRERHDLDRGRDLLRRLGCSGQRRRACSRSSSTT